MNRLWRQLGIRANWPILLAVGVLAAFGLLSIWARRPADAQKQAIFLVLGIAALSAFQAVDYRWLGRFAWAFYAAALALIGYTLLGSVVSVPGVEARNGAYNWIDFGPASLQPAELMKIAFVMVLARYLRFRSNYRTLTGLIPPFLLAVTPVALILKQPDLGTALIFGPTLLIMLFAAGARLRHLLGVVGLGLAVSPLIWLSGADLPVFRNLPELIRPYQRSRVYAMLGADTPTLRSVGYQQEQALIALGSGGWTGKGLGSIPVGRGVPEAHNDMVFALVGEQFGLFGCLVVIGAYLVLLVAGLEVAGATREPFGRLLAVGIVAVFAVQTFLNLAVALRLLPVTGVTLPFISYGGSSLLTSCLAAGLLLNIGQNRPMVMARDSFEFD